ncbi:MAG: flagellin, partial [Gallionella sp.]
MSQVINTNIASLGAQNNLSKSQNTLQTALQRLSSGMRINSAKDDAAGMAIADRMSSQINGLNQALRNANDGISMAQTADGALGEVTNILQRMRQLAVQSANASNSDTDRQSLNSEVSQLKQELTRIASTTQFNGQNVLDGSQQNIGFHVGAQANQSIGISIGDARATSVGTNIAYSDNATNGIVKPTAYNRYSTGGTETGVAVAGAVGANGRDVQTITITNASGATIEGGAISLNANDQASDIAERLNALQGVHATGYNAVTLSGWDTSGASNAEDLVFTIQSGAATQTLTLTGINSTSSQSAVFSSLQSAINGNSTLTNAGVTAGLDGNGSLV